MGNYIYNLFFLKKDTIIYEHNSIPYYTSTKLPQYVKWLVENYQGAGDRIHKTNAGFQFLPKILKLAY